MSAHNTPKADDASQLLRLSQQLAQAEQLRLSRQFDKAESTCVALLRQHPDFFGAHYTLGLIHADRGDPIKALPHLLRAVMRGPHNALASVTFAGVLIETNALDLAAHILDLAALSAPDDTSLLVIRGELFHRTGQHTDARNCFRRALELEPTFLEAAIGLARAHYAIGEFLEGVAVIDNMIAGGHLSVDALFTLSQVPDKFITRDLALAADQAQRQVLSTDTDSFATLDFIRAGALQRGGDYARAWAKAADANKRIFAQRQTQMKPLRAKYQEGLAQLSQQGKLKPRQDPNQPVSLFLMGPSRSGKTSLERLVSTLGPVRRHYERSLITEATRWSFQSVGMADMFPLQVMPHTMREIFCEKYFHLLAGGQSDAIVHTSTNPSDILQMASVIDFVPNSRVVCIKRNHDDLALRIFMSHYNSGNAYAYDLASIYEHLAIYDQLMDALATAAPDVVRIVTYEDMVTDPRATLTTVANLCGVSTGELGSVQIGDDRNCAAPYLEFMRR